MMKIARTLLAVGAVLGGTAVGFGAYAEHKLRPLLDANAYHSVSIAQQYHLLHGLLVAVLALVVLAKPELAPRRLLLAAGLFVVGIVLFSFSIYTGAITGDASYRVVTPSGGTTFMLAWLVLASAAWPWGKHAS